jgi:hypothetical protein
VLPAREIILRELLTVAREGLRRANLTSADIDRYLGVIEERVQSGRTGSQWLLRSLAEMPSNGDGKDSLVNIFVP